MSKGKSDKKVAEVEARLFQLEKKLDALLSMMIQEFSADFEDDDSEDGGVALPSDLQTPSVFDFKNDSDLLN